MIRATLIPAALLLALATTAPAPASAHDEEGGSILPDDEDLKQLGELAQRWMKDFAAEIAPMAERLQTLIDDLDAYEAPEMLPNGDIIIRRRPDAPPPRDRNSPEDEGGVTL